MARPLRVLIAEGWYHVMSGETGGRSCLLEAVARGARRFHRGLSHRSAQAVCNQVAKILYVANIDLTPLPL